MSKKIKTIRPLAPDDLRTGMYVVITHLIGEHIPFCFDEASWRDRTTPIRIAWMPGNGGEPLRVESACVPFVLVERADGTHATLDMRQYKLARLSKRYARQTRKRLKKSSKKSQCPELDLV
jgi:hypothetical protein